MKEQFEITQENNGERLDVVLSSLTGKTRSNIGHLIDMGKVCVDGKVWRFLGASADDAMTQVSLDADAMTTTAVYEAGGIRLTAKFTSPMLVEDLYYASRPVSYLKLSYESVEKRLGDLTKRGVVFRPGQTLKRLYEERCPLYEEYADCVVECDGQEIGETLEQILGCLAELS